MGFLTCSLQVPRGQELCFAEPNVQQAQCLLNDFAMYSGEWGRGLLL